MRILTIIATLLALAATGGLAQDRTTLAYGTHPRQTMDVYAPDGAENAPVIIMLHGGGWAIGDKRNRGVWQDKAAHWLAQGVGFVSVNTRLVPDADPLTQAQDLATAIATFQSQAGVFGIDPQRTILIGHSSGAHVAGLVATDDHLRDQAGLLPSTGVILLDTPAIDLETMMQRNPPRFYMRAFGTDPAYWRDASPMTHLDADDGAFLVVCSTQRRTSCATAQHFQRSAARYGVPVTVMPEDLSHGDISTLLGVDRSYTDAVDGWIASLQD